MAMQCVTSGMLMCTFGTAPSAFSATPRMTKSGNQIAANIMCNKPMVNIKPFSPCNAPSNPSNWKGPVFTPGPCIPVIPAPWAPGAPTVMIDNMPALNNTSKCMCTWGGVIQFTTPGQFTHNIP
ncbi:DUF4280 domain-containing protein [Rubrimonas cliftonensis]|uniref:DUF4280 domain-containing protein n=1 Tax=Rubrimonas cliftonensis TaxID=89524 RepID=A0A1H4BGP7_9RHOB|nr:DUF4280 domain-containing protein [Rubrimonas cliftonensis]SEA47188.1 protein of unknown function [Rubrimonas cliftonensis]